jgi:molybdopterin converting factor small subunit
LISTSQYVESILEELKGTLGSVREMNASLSEAQAGTVAKEEAAAVKREYEALIAKLQRDWVSQNEKVAQEMAALAEDRAMLDSAIKDGDERLSKASLEEAEAKLHVISL